MKLPQLALRLALIASSGLAALAAAPAQAADSGGNCRFGIAAPRSIQGYDLDPLGVGAYLDWGLAPADPAPGIQYIHVIRLRDADRQFIYSADAPQTQTQFEETLRAAVSRYPGEAWLVGNEPDTAFETQDGLTPQQYALAYHHIWALVKSLDPGAQLGIGTIVQPTPLRMQWLDDVLSEYRTRYGVTPPSDFWSIHSFILREQRGDWGTGIPPGLSAESGALYTLEQTDDLGIFGQRLVAFRRWMADHGQQTKPLWITEYGSLLPHDGQAGFVTQPIERARDYMLGTFDTLLTAADPRVGYPYDGGKLVQRWFWYSLNDDLWRFGGSLYDPATKQSTVIGDAFAAYVTGLPLGADPQLVEAAVVGHRPQLGRLVAQALLVNDGNTSAPGPFTLRWLDGAGNPLAPPVVLGGPLPGCGAARIITNLLPLPPGTGGAVFAQLQTAGGPAQLRSAGVWKSSAERQP